MLHSHNDGVIVRSLIGLGQNLGRSVVAEGVETQEVWEELQRLGCDLAQGYWISRPMPAEAMRGWLSDRPALVANGTTVAIHPEATGRAQSLR